MFRLKKKPLFKSNDALVDAIASDELFFGKLDARVEAAMRKIDRRAFLADITPNDEIRRKLFGYQKYNPKTIADLAYVDDPLPIGHDQTCSQPLIVAYMANQLQLQEGMNVLEIGSGCFYNGAVLAELVGENGQVISIELIPKLAERARNNARRHFDGRYDNTIVIIEGDGKLGFQQRAPYDRIVLTAGVKRKSSFICSDDYARLESQLKPDGKVLFPEEKGSLYLMEYANGTRWRERTLIGVRFVQLK